MKAIIFFLFLVVLPLFASTQKEVQTKEVIKTIELNPTDLKTLNAKFIQDKHTEKLPFVKPKQSEVQSIDILDNILFSAGTNFDTKIDKRVILSRYQLNIIYVPTQGSVDVVHKLQESKINTGIVRGDVLGIYNNGFYGFEPFQNYGILCATGDSILYLVAKRPIKSIYNFRGMKISVGNISNMAQVYLNDMLQNSGIAPYIEFKGYDFNTSLNLIKKDKLDALFMFGDESYKQKIKEEGLYALALPLDALRFLKKRKGLIPYSYTFNDKVVTTFSVPNFLVAPLKTLDIDISKKIEAMVDQFQCYKKIQNIDPIYGAIHPDVKNAIANIRAREKKESELSQKLNSIEITLQKKQNIQDSTQYIYEVANHSKFDQNISFDYYRTKLFDKTAIKPRHVLNNFPKGVIEVKAKSQRVVTFIYKNNFTTKIKDTNITVVFKDLSNKGNYITTILNIEDDK